MGRAPGRRVPKAWNKGSQLFLRVARFELGDRLDEAAYDERLLPLSNLHYCTSLYKRLVSGMAREAGTGSRHGTFRAWKSAAQ